MKKLIIKIQPNKLIFGFCIMFSILFISVQAVKSQVPPNTCLPPDSASLPPDSASLPHFKQGNKVYYNFAANIPVGSSERGQIVTAFNNWHAANQLNCSKVEFYEGTAPSGFGYAQITVENAQIGAVGSVNPDYITGGGSPASNDPTANLLGEVTSAYLYFHPQLKADPSLPNLIYDPAKPGYDTMFTKEAMHEIGHLMGLTHYTSGHNPSCTQQSPGASVMNDACGYNDSEGLMSTTVKSCDTTRLNGIFICPTPTPTPPPIIPPIPLGCVNAQAFNGTACPTGFARSPTNGYYCCQTSSCAVPNNDPTCLLEKADCLAFNGNWKGCCTGCFSPIVIDVLGNGFNLTDGANGVDLDLTGEGTKDRTAWTSPNSDDAWLVLDRNHNGVIDNALELFGNFTEQPEAIPVADRNGFLALAVFDQPQNGGNGDGKINRQDRIYNDLRLWQDVNHNGISEPGELHTLDSLDVRALDLDFKVSRRTDEFGNRFRYRAKVRDSRDADVGKWAWDVFPVKPR